MKVKHLITKNYSNNNEFLVHMRHKTGKKDAMGLDIYKARSYNILNTKNGLIDEKTKEPIDSVVLNATVIDYAASRDFNTIIINAYERKERNKK